MILIAVAIVLVIVIAYWSWPRPDNSLYKRLGGIYAIAAVINDFSDRILNDPLVGRDSPNPELKAWHTTQLDRLPGLKWMRTLWVAEVSGGPYKFIPTVGGCPFTSRLNLTSQHKKFHMSSEEFDAVAAILSATLNDFKVPDKETGEVLAAFAAHKKDIVH